MLSSPAEGSIYSQPSTSTKNDSELPEQAQQKELVGLEDKITGERGKRHRDDEVELEKAAAEKKRKVEIETSTRARNASPDAKVEVAMNKLRQKRPRLTSSMHSIPWFTADRVQPDGEAEPLSSIAADCKRKYLEETRDTQAQVRHLEQQMQDLQGQYLQFRHILNAEPEVLRLGTQRRAESEAIEKKGSEEQVKALRSMLVRSDKRSTRLSHKLRVVNGRFMRSQQEVRRLILELDAAHGQIHGDQAMIDMLEDERQANEACLIECSDENASLEGQIADRDGAIDSLQEELTSRDEKIDSLEEELTSRDGKIATLEEVKTKTDQLADVQSKHASARNDKENAVFETMSMLENSTRDVFGDSQYLNFIQRVFQSSDWNGLVDRLVA